MFKNSAPGLQFLIEGGLITSKSIMQPPQLYVAMSSDRIALREMLCFQSSHAL